MIIEYPIEVCQGLHRYLRLSQLHRGTGRAVEHPPFHGRRYSRFMLDNENSGSAALLSVVKSNLPTVKRMPAVMGYFDERFAPLVVRETMKRSKADKPS